MKINTPARHMLLILTWLLLWRLAVFMEYAPHASIWFPPAGLTFAAFLLLGWRALPAILTACVLSTFWEAWLLESSRSLQALLGAGMTFALQHTLIYGIGASLLRESMKHANPYNLYQVVMRFLLIAAASSLVMALVGGFFLYEVTSARAFMNTGLIWWIGDLSGVLVLAPLFLGIINHIRPQMVLLEALTVDTGQTGLRPFAGKLALSAVLLGLITLATRWLESDEIACFIFFLTLPLMWIVYTEPPFRAILALALLSFLSALLVMVFGMDRYAYIYQFAINVIACSTYSAMAVPALVSDNAALRQKACIDPLTQTLTREFFMEQVGQWLRLDRTTPGKAALLVFDVDRFKQINDHFGHTIGDEVLARVALEVKSQLGKEDILGRFGGDEFMLLLPDADIEQAHAAAESLRYAINQLPFAQAELTVSCSFGIAALDARAGFQSAFETADANLLAAKRQGRNQARSSVSA